MELFRLKTLQGKHFENENFAVEKYLKVGTFETHC